MRWWSLKWYSVGLTLNILFLLSVFAVYFGQDQSLAISLVSFNSTLNLLLAGVFFLYPLKTSENCRISDVFRGYKRGAPSNNGLKSISAVHYVKSVKTWSFSRSVFSRIRTEYWDLYGISGKSSHSFQIRRNTNQKKLSL